MKRKEYLTIIAGLAVLTGTAGFLISQQTITENVPDIENQIDTPDSTSYKATALFGNNTVLQLEIADTREERARGLMNRPELKEGTGMLFIFPSEKERSFWMKNTLIPLDMIFLAENRSIVDIHHAYPEPGVPVGSLKRYTSPPAKYVIEANINFTREYSIEKGDKVELSVP